MKLKSLLKVPQSKYDAKTILKWLWQAWQGNQLQAVLNACIGFASVGVSLAQVWAVQRAIDVASGAVHGSIYWAVALMGVFILCDFSLNIASVWLRNILGIKAQNHMQQHMLDRILRSEWQGKETRHSGDVLNRLEFDVNNVVNFLTETIPNTLSVLAMFIGAFCYLFLMDKVLAVITVAIIPVFIAVSKIYVRQMRRLTREVRSQDSEVQSVLQETIQHRMLIKTLEGEGPMVDRLEHSQSRLRHKVVTRTAFSVFSNLILNLGFALNGRSYTDFWRHDSFPSISSSHTGTCAKPDKTGSCFCLCLHSGRTFNGIGGEPTGRKGFACVCSVAVWCAS